MQQTIPIHELTKLTDAELLNLEAALRDLILTQSLTDEGRARCATSLSNAVFVLSLRRQAPRL